MLLESKFYKEFKKHVRESSKVDNACEAKMGSRQKHRNGMLSLMKFNRISTDGRRKFEANMVKFPNVMLIY